MKYLKISGLAVLAVAALMTFAAGASATSLTSPLGTTYTGVVQAETAGEMIVHGTVESRCKSTFEWEVNGHGPGAPVKGPVNAFYLLECSGGTSVVPLKLGTFQLHTRTKSADGDGTLTWTGAEFAYKTSPPTIECRYGFESQNADVGILTGSISTSGTARVDIDAILIRVGGSPFCPITSKWTAEYEITSPDYLDVD